MDRLKKELSKQEKIFLIIIPVIIAVVFCCFFIWNGIKKTDVAILLWVSKWNTPTLTEIMKWITNLCSPIVILLIVLCLLLFMKNKKISCLITINLFFCALVNYILKFIFSRQRPLEFMLIDQAGYSFPSGHSMVSMAFYGFIIFLIYKLVKTKWIKIASITILTLVIFSIAFSRIYLGVHYPSDVIVGLTCGYVYIILFLKMVKSYMLNTKV